MRLLLLALTVALAVVCADFTESLPPALNHPAIDYYGRPVSDPVAKLIPQGSEKLVWESRGGYLRSLLAALDVPVESQIAVFSKTSLQADRISPSNPRTIFFNDSVSVAWMWGGFIEMASHDPQQGIIFYTLAQNASDRPRFERTNDCLRCHRAEGTLGVAGMLVESVYPGPGGEPMLIYGRNFSDHRTKLTDRWGGWFVTGATGRARHMGNAVVSDRDNPKLESPPLPTLAGKFPADRYLSQHSDSAALLVFDHQMHMMNLITRIGWETRAALHEKRSDLSQALAQPAGELVDYMLFLDEAPLAGRTGGTSGFAAAFAARGPRDSKGRSLRQLDLEKRLLKYPCSYMIYSPAFDALPAEAKSAIYQQMWQALSTRVQPATRQAIIEILRETKSDLPRYFF